MSFLKEFLSVDELPTKFLRVFGKIGQVSYKKVSYKKSV